MISRDCAHFKRRCFRWEWVEFLSGAQIKGMGIMARFMKVVFLITAVCQVISCKGELPGDVDGLQSLVDGVEAKRERLEKVEKTW